MLKQDSTKSENMVQPNSETIFIINNNKSIYKNNNTAHARDEPDNNSYLNKNFINLINNFTDNVHLRTAIAEYIKMRLNRPKTVTTEYAVTLALKRLTELSADIETQIKILNQSILNSYPDLYGLKKTGGANNDFNRRNDGNQGNGKPDVTGAADRKTDGRPDFAGAVRLGASG
jgi:hypothetical protein